MICATGLLTLVNQDDDICALEVIYFTSPPCFVYYLIIKCIVLVILQTLKLLENSILNIYIQHSPSGMGSRCDTELNWRKLNDARSLIGLELTTTCCDTMLKIIKQSLFSKNLSYERAMFKIFEHMLLFTFGKMSKIFEYAIIYLRRNVNV